MSTDLQAFEVYNPYVLTVTVTSDVALVHKPCNATVLLDDPIELGSIMRAAYAHTQSCRVVNRKSRHSAVG